MDNFIRAYFGIDLLESCENEPQIEKTFLQQSDSLNLHSQCQSELLAHKPVESPSALMLYNLNSEPFQKEGQFLTIPKFGQHRFGLDSPINHITSSKHLERIAHLEKQRQFYLNCLRSHNVWDYPEGKKDLKTIHVLRHIYFVLYSAFCQFLRLLLGTYKQHRQLLLKLVKRLSNINFHSLFNRFK